MGEFTNKVLVVTGGSRGIGRAIVLEAVARGARVAFCARRVDNNAQQVAAEAERIAGPGIALPVQADVSREDDVEALFDATIRNFGRVDVVVNNAGIYGAGGMIGLMLQVPTEDWDTVIATNLTGAFLVSRRAVKEFLAQGTGGVIIYTGSISQDGGTGLVSYGVSKAGLLGLANSITEQYGNQNVRAHVIVAGYLNTDLNKDAPEVFRQTLINWGPQNRSGLVEEIASVALFLASPRAALVNGAPIFVSGGAKELPAYLVQTKSA